MCNEDIELLCLSLRPFYLPREFGNILICSVYVPPDGNASRAAFRVADCVQEQLQRTPNAPIFVMGDFNHCSLNIALPGFEQYIKCDTRKNKTLDKCYGNVKSAYTAVAKPPLANSDHNTVLLIPTYRTALKNSKSLVKSVNVWSSDSIETLKGCFLCTDWDMFSGENNLDYATEVTTDYIQFCIDTVIPKKTIKTFPNSKPYITKEVKDCITRRKHAFRNNDQLQLRAVQSELNQRLREAKQQHKETLEENLQNMNTRKLWASVRTMTNMKSTKKPFHAVDELSTANELNRFYKRFETQDFSAECNSALENISTDWMDRFLIDPKEVETVFKNVTVNKATGPDGISAFVLKTFAEELTPAWCSIFQRSVDSNTVPAMWKKAVITPVPKKTCPKENNDFRPVALTPVVMKCMERIMVSRLRSEVGPQLDPYQFAYRHHRGTDDAINSIVHMVTKHLENPKAYARLLFVDFSSAFNTLQPHILLNILNQLNVNPFIIKWYHSFLTNRTQHVRVNSTVSEPLTISTGAPQGSVSSPVLFTLYTNEITSHTENQYIVKFSDDTAILGLMLTNFDAQVYKSTIQNFVQWCDKHHLILNTKKTEEMVFDPKSLGDHSPVVIHGHAIAQVDSYRYLGIHMDNKLVWKVHVDAVCSRVQQRLHFLRRLRTFGVNREVQLLFYHAVVESLLRYGISAWFGNLTVQSKAQITRLIQTAMKIMGVSQHPSLQAIFQQTITRQAQKIISDPTHVLHPEYQLLPSGRRYRVPLSRYNRFKHSFVPLSIKALNS